VIEVRNQADLDRALERPDVLDGQTLVIVRGNGRFVINKGSPRMVSRGQSSPTMESWGQSSPRMESWEQSSPTMVSWGQSSPTMVSWEQSSPTMVSWEQSSVTGEVGRFAQPRIWRHDQSQVSIPGAVILEVPKIKTAADWCDFYEVEVRKGGNLARDLAGQDVAILFKALDKDFQSYHRFTYTPGTAPAAPDWDGGQRECGGGLHFSPHPRMAEEFEPNAERYVACPVLVSEIVVHPDGMYPQKVKAPRVCAPCWEVDGNGERVGGKS